MIVIMLGLGVFLIILATVLRKENYQISCMLFLAGIAVAATSLLARDPPTNPNITQNELLKDPNELSVLHRTPVYL
jgi:hypothetical protein